MVQIKPASSTVWGLTISQWRAIGAAILVCGMSIAGTLGCLPDKPEPQPAPVVETVNQ